jgi:urease accessory protein
MKSLVTARTLSVAAAIAVASPIAAQAHHAMGNATPGNLFEGFVSGLAHPVIGVDHLLFVLAMGAAACYFGRKVGTICAFVGATLVGTVVHLYKAALPYPDAWVALSLVVLGVLFVRGQGVLKSNAALAFFGIAGIAHGYAYGESIVGAEPTPLVAYLAGFTLVQLAIAAGGYALATVVERKRLGLRSSAALGGVLSLAGAVFLLASIL